jgi:histidine triad (HIT) family protein
MSRPELVCVFCEIVAERAPAEVLARAFASIAIRPRGGVHPEHVLFIPRVHVADAAESPFVTGQVAADAARWAQARGEPFNLITSAGAAATQSIFHLHFHYVPRSVGDGLSLPWSSPEESRSCPT